MDNIVRSKRELGSIIRMARKRQNLTQANLARKASVRQALISDIENGVTTAKLDTITRVLAALELDMSIVPRRTTEFDPWEY